MKWGITIIILTLILLAGCGEAETMNISKDGSFTAEECASRGLDENTAIMIESKYCGHCQETKPVFLQAAGTRSIIPELIDVAEDEGRTRMSELAVSVQYTPTFIIGCDYYVGVQEDYLEILP